MKIYSDNGLIDHPKEKENLLEVSDVIKKLAESDTTRMYDVIACLKIMQSSIGISITKLTPHAEKEITKHIQSALPKED